MANESVVQRIELLKGLEARNLIIIGEEKETMSKYAFEIAAAWLHTDISKLSYHPDYQFICAENGSIRSEQAERIQRMAAFIPCGDKAVCIVKDAETMTIELQNKLLKVLEDGEKSLAVIFITASKLIDTVTSRCMTLKFQKTTLGEMAARPGYNKLPIMLACDGNMELYKKIEGDAEFSQYLEGFFNSLCGIKERSKLKNILRLTHALREKDTEYLPEKFEEWQMQAFLCMVKKLFWHVLIKQNGLTVPQYIRMGNLPDLYCSEETEVIYRKVEEAIVRNHKKGAFSKNDFFELLTYMIPLD